LLRVLRDLRVSTVWVSGMVCISSGWGKAPLVRDREIGGQQWLIIDLDQERVVAGLRETEVANLVDEIDPVEGALGLERAFKERLRVGGIKPHRDAQFVLPGRAIAEGEKPDHEGVRDGKFAGLDVGKDAEDRVFARAGIDVDAVAGEPGEELRFGMHTAKQGGGDGSGQMIFVGHA
jgi:hypothetical protein